MDEPDGGNTENRVRKNERRREVEGRGYKNNWRRVSFTSRIGVVARMGVGESRLLMEAAPDVIFLLGVTPSTFRQCEDFSAKYQTSVVRRQSPSSLLILAQLRSPMTQLAVIIKM